MQSKAPLSLLVGIVMLHALVQCTYAGTVWVDGANGDNHWSGRCEFEQKIPPNCGPKRTIEDPYDAATNGYGGVHVAASGDIVLVKPFPNGYVLTKTISFPSFPITLKSTNGPSVTTITREPSNGLTKVSFEQNQGPGSVIEGFTITGGLGVAITCINASPTIRGNIITQNGVSGSSAGGIFLRGSNSAGNAAVIENNTISNNYVPVYRLSP